MPLREGTLTQLIVQNAHDGRQVAARVLEQMLSALDYLESMAVVHRDLKPDNILYHFLPNDRIPHFELADFGLAMYRSLAVTNCGTGQYKAPELFPMESMVQAPQSPKMDVWSLFATMAAIDKRFTEFPPRTSDYRVILNKLEEMASNSALEPMGRRHPDHRASAAQMLVRFFSGRGLTTPPSSVPPIMSRTELLQGGPSPAAEPSNPPQTRANVSKTHQQPEAAVSPLVLYPPRGQDRLSPAPPSNPFTRMPPGIPNRGGNPWQVAAPQPILARGDGVFQRQPESLAARANALARPLPEREPRVLRPRPLAARVNTLARPPPGRESPVPEGPREDFPWVPGAFLD